MSNTSLPKHGFFKKPKDVLSGADNKLIETLIAEISFLQSVFEDELELADDRHKESLRAALERSNIRLDTLHKMKENQPIEAKNLNLLLQYGENSKYPEITDYPHILSESSLKY